MSSGEVKDRNTRAVPVQGEAITKLIEDFAFEAGKSAIAVLEDVDYRTPEGIIIKQGFNRAYAALHAALSPPARGLTDAEIRQLWEDHTVPVFGKTGINPTVFARLVEKAHGIPPPVAIGINEAGGR